MPGQLSPRWRMVLVVVGLATFLRLPSLFHQLYDVDEAAIAAQGIVVRDGGTLYEEAVDRKPPLVPLVYGVVFAATDSNDLRYLHGAAAAGLAACGLLVAAEASRSIRTRARHRGPAELRLEDLADFADGDPPPIGGSTAGALGTAPGRLLAAVARPQIPERLGRRAAWWGAGLVVTGLVVFFPVDAQAANFAHFAVVPGTVAMVAARRGTKLTALLAGMAVGVAVLCRQTWVLGIPPAMVGAALASGRPRQGLLIPVGALVPVAAVSLVVPFGEFVHWTFTGNGSFVLADTSATGAAARGVASVLVFTVGHLTICWLLAVRAGDDLAFLRGRWPQHDVITAAREVDLDVWLWWLSGLGATVLGFRFYGHYWLQAVPPAALLAAPMAARLAPRWDHVARWGVAAPTAVAFTLACIPGTVRPVLEVDELVAYVEQHSRRTEPVMVWGNLPQLAWSADRPLGGGLVHMDFVTGLSGGREPNLETVDDATAGAEDKLLHQMDVHPPQLVLDTSTADIHGYAAYPIRAFPRIQAVLDARYQRVAVVEGVTIYQLPR